MIIAVDFDGTLTTGETGRKVGEYFARNGFQKEYRRFIMGMYPRYFLAKAGLMDMRAFKVGWGRSMPQMFKGLPQDELLRLLENAVQETGWNHRREDVIAELEARRAAGARIVIVTAAYQPMVEFFARRIGAEVLGTALAFENGRSTGKVVPPVNAGQVKVDRLRKLVGGDRLAAAYSDTLDDLPMLEMADEPVAVYPAENLRRLAETRGWRILGG